MDLKRKVMMLSGRINELQRELSEVMTEYADPALEVVSCVAEYYKLADPLLKKRYKRYVRARRVITEILRNQGYSFPEIGDIYGQDPSTVISATKSQ